MFLKNQYGCGYKLEIKKSQEIAASNIAEGRSIKSKEMQNEIDRYLKLNLSQEVMLLNEDQYECVY
jgi:hypothetical protein